MDNINDLENSSKEQLVEKVESMQEEIDSLKEENSKAKSNLMWKVRKLEKDKVLIENEKIRLERETKSLRSEVERFRSPPLVLATITEVLDDYRMTVKSSTGPSFLVNYSKFLDEKLLVPGSRVALNQQTFGIVEVLPSEKDANVTGMEIETKPDITYDKIGGLEEQIVEVKETVELPLKEPELFEKIGIDPPKGILLYGPPGTGKTLLAKAVANETNATFIKIVASEFVKKYIGEGARLVREVFELAKEKAPAIIFIDELDAVAAKRLKSSTSGDREVQRTLMQLLAELDGFESRGDIGIIGATNRPDILDPALLRPGRFDRFIEVPLPNDDGRKQILKIHTKNMALDEEADLDLLSSLTDGLSGADLKAVFTPANSTDTIVWKSYNNGVATVDVNGRVTGAKAGTLSILVGGNKEDYEACMPLFEAMGTNINYQGEAGCGQHAKMVNQIMIAGTMSGLCEALSYAKAKDLDCETVLKSVATGAAGSKQLDFFGEKILHGDYTPGFFMKHFIKDMKIALIEANQCELDLDVLSQTLANYEVLEAEGYGDLGTQALIKYYEEGYNEEIIED